MRQIVTNIFHKYCYKPKYDVWWSNILAVIICFIEVAFAWIFFRANNVNDAFVIVGKIFTCHGTAYWPESSLLNAQIIIGLGLLVLKDLKDEIGIKHIGFDSKYVIVRFAFYLALAYLSLINIGGEQQFIYFQF